MFISFAIIVFQFARLCLGYYTLNREGEGQTELPTCEHNHRVNGVEDIINDPQLPPEFLPPLRVCVKASWPSSACLEEEQDKNSSLVLFAHGRYMYGVFHNFKVSDMKVFEHCHVFTPCDILDLLNEREAERVYGHIKLDAQAVLRGKIWGPVHLTVTAAFNFGPATFELGDPILGVYSTVCRSSACEVELNNGGHDVKTQVLTPTETWPTCTDFVNDKSYGEDDVFVAWLTTDRQ